MIGNEDELKKKIFDLIDKKKEVMLEQNDHLNYVSNIIKDLNGFIDDQKFFTETEIKKMLSNLVQYRVVLDIPILENTLLLRGVKIGNGLKFPHYDKVSRISYIPDNQINKAKLGRCNRVREPMFYACIANSIKNVNIPFSEIGAKEQEHINILISKTAKELNLRFVGLYDYYKRGTMPPFQVHNVFEEVYQYYVDTHDEFLLSAIELCDAFFCDIFRRKGHCRLYEVTSVLSELYMESDVVDGLIYPSVETEGAPNVVIKPNAVRQKITYKEVKVYLIRRDYGYSKYYAMELSTKGKVQEGHIYWSEPIQL